MAGIKANIMGNEIALAAAAAKTVLRLDAPANQRLTVLGWGVSFDSVGASDAAVIVELLRVTTTGTMTTATPVRVDAGAETLQGAGAHTATAEPTAGDVLKRLDIDPRGGGYEEACPYGQEYIIPGGGRLAIRCTAGAAVNVIPFIRYEE